MKGSSTISSESGLRKGAWAEEEDLLLRMCIKNYGEGKWRQVPLRAGLNRCRKSCRLRWLNYLQPNINRGEFKPDEVDLIIRMHKLLGNRWSLIAGRLPGRTANDIKNYYNTHLKKTCFSKYNTEKGQQVLVTKKSGRDNNAYQDGQDHEHRMILKRRRVCPRIITVDHHHDNKHIKTQVLRPQPRTFSKISQSNVENKATSPTRMNNNNITTTTGFPNNSHVIYKNITTCLSLLVDDHPHDKFSPINDQHIRDINSTDHWLKNILFSETVEEDSKKKKEQITSNNYASLEFENAATFGVEDGSSDAYYCNFDGDQKLKEGGNVGVDIDHYWDSLHLDDNLRHMLGEDKISS